MPVCRIFRGMPRSFNRIAYEALAVCNPVALSTIADILVATGLKPDEAAVDIGCGNATVSILLAERFGLHVDAVEQDPSMADLAQERIDRSAVRERITLWRQPSPDVLAILGTPALIVALGVTEPVEIGVRDPEGMLRGLAERLADGGWLLWGDLIWTAEPAEPVRRRIEQAIVCTDDAGWRAAATAAGFELIRAVVSDTATWADYRTRMSGAVAAWLAAHPEDLDAEAIRGRADQLAMIHDQGRDSIGFGLYLFRKT